MNRKILGIFTCYNRKELTLQCLESLKKGNPDLEFAFLAVDDASIDGTVEALDMLSDVEVLKGDGGLYYSGGMRKGIAAAKEKVEGFDYCLIINDDVKFYPHVIEKMIEQNNPFHEILVGSTCDKSGRLSYGGVKKCSKYRPRFQTVMSTEKKLECDTFNANCVLIPFDIFQKLPNIDEVYVHSMGDFDYGLVAKEKGYSICSTSFFVGICEDNPVSKTWKDTHLSRKQRLQLKESPKGLPAKEWFHFVKKHFGLCSACYSTMLPYIKIILKR